jgi:type VI secretion system protein ImpJ
MDGVMGDFRLARVHFFAGQTLLPEHFTAQEQSITAEAALRVHLLGLPDCGVARLRIKEATLARGVLEVEELIAQLPGRTLVYVPANTVLDPLPLVGAVESPVSVYLHVMEETPMAKRSPLYEQDPPIVRRVVRTARLSFDDAPRGPYDSLKLCRLSRTGAAGWSIDGSYIPPLLQCGGEPFLRSLLGQVADALRVMEVELRHQLGHMVLRLERQVEARRLLARLMHLRSQLADMNALGTGATGRNDFPVRLHPYFLFDALRAYYFDLSAFQEDLSGLEEMPYMHEDLGGSLHKLVAGIGRLTGLKDVSASVESFQLENGRYHLPSFPDALRSAKEVYLLLEKPSPHESVSTQGVKLAAQSRLEQVHRLVLNGVPYRKLEQVLFPHPFGPEVEFYQLLLGEEWKYVLKERTLAFYRGGGWRSIKAHIMWR